MKPGFIYRFISQSFHETDDIQVWVDIEDWDNMVADDFEQTIYAPIPTGEPIKLSCIDNNEDVFKVIRPQQLTIKFHSTTEINSTTFASGSDERWKVKAYIDENSTKVFFYGYLIMTGMDSPFMPHPNEVTLIATDNLGTLKDIPLSDFSDANPTGYNKISTFLAWCLSKTNLLLELVVAFNIRHGTGALVSPTGGVNFHSTGSVYTIRVQDQYEFFAYVGQRITVTGSASNNSTFTVIGVTTATGTTFIEVLEVVVGEFPLTGVTLTDASSALHLFNTVFLHARTWEDEIGTSINCYEVLEKILYGANLFQRQGKWYIVRIDEREGNGMYFETFNSSGVSALDLTLKTVDKNIGKDGYDILFSEGATKVLFDRPRKSVRLDFDYTYPMETPCNVDFVRGDLIDGSDPLHEIYALDCWTVKEGVPGFSGTVDGTTARIHRINNSNGYELERYIVLTPRTSFETSSINDATYAESEVIPLNLKDKFIVRGDFRLTNITSGLDDRRLMRAILHGEDDSWWILGIDGSGNPFWWDTANWTANSGEGTSEVDFGSDDWQNMNWESPPTPVGGDLYIWLNQLNQNSGPDDTADIQYSNLSFEYIPYIDGTYRILTGHYHKVTQDDYRAKIEKTVYMGDAPNKLVKGAMFIFNGTTYILTSKFWNAAVFPLGPPDGTYIHPYGEIQVFDVWNQYNREMRIFYATMQGIDAGELDASFLPNHASLVHRYIFQDVTPDTFNKSFVCLTLDQDWRNQSATGTFRECHSSTINKVYLGHEFKYKE